MKKNFLLILSFFTMTLQSQNKIKSSLSEIFNGTTWDKSSGMDFEYDGNNNLITEIQYNWEISGWGKSSETTYTYNTANKATEMLFKTWDGSQFINNFRNINTYSAGGLIIQTLYQEWNLTQWKDVEKTDLTYNGSLPSVGISYKWNGSQWINDYRSTITYSESLPQQSLNERWNGTQWNIESRDVLTYNVSNKIIANVNETWNGAVWTENYRTNYQLDANINRLNQTEIYQGVIQSKTEYNFDFTVPLSNFAHPFRDKTGLDYFFEGMPYFNKILSANFNLYDSATSTYEALSRTTYNYDSSLSSSDESKIRGIKLYPNPSADFIKISGMQKHEKIIIYSILGAKVFEKIIAPDTKINIQPLESGSYILRLENGQSLKFLKK